MFSKDYVHIAVIYSIADCGKFSCTSMMMENPTDTTDVYIIVSIVAYIIIGRYYYYYYPHKMNGNDIRANNRIQMDMMMISRAYIVDFTSFTG